MTASALVKQSDLKRMAQIAKREGVTVWIEVNGKKIGVSPDIPDIPKPTPVDLKPEDFTSLSDWQAWRDQERARETQRHS